MIGMLIDGTAKVHLHQFTIAVEIITVSFNHISVESLEISVERNCLEMRV
jgi:hypothetical protein